MSARGVLLPSARVGRAGGRVTAGHRADAPGAPGSPGAVGRSGSLPRVDQPTATALAAVAEVLASRGELWGRLVGVGGRRWSTRVAGGAGWEAWLVAWPGGESAQLDRPDGPGAVVLLSGELTVTGRDGPQRLVPGVALGYEARAVPALRNPTGHLAVSLQVLPLRRGGPNGPERVEWRR